MGNDENIQLVTDGFNKLLNAVAPYVAMELISAYGDDKWWQEGVLDRLYDDQKFHLPVSGDFGILVDSLDIARCLLLMDVQWKEVFRKKLPQDCKNYVMELKGTRNKWAHVGSQGFSTDDACRALDTMSRLCEQIDPDTAAEINVLLRKARYGNEEGSTANLTNNTVVAVKPKTAIINTKAATGLPSWREVMEPHMDVAEGRYKNAEFAADLSQVARGKGELEYRDPIEFFNRTYVTEGMKGLLVQGLRRVSGLDGEPVIQLKTAFGGGKTHSMLALYHMMRSRARVTQIKNLQPVLEESGVSVIPEVHVAVIVGTALDPASTKRPATLPGCTVNTIWGEIAFQLAESTGNPAIYNYIKEADKKGVSPGSQTLADMFDACGCCLILMDELVAYAKKLYGQDKLPAGTLDNFITFIQELTEAARASRCSLVVASIPESDNEIGGEAGQRALEQIEHTFGRMEAIWKPVAANEGFEVVRRRLFLNCKDEQAREDVCAAFSRMYNDNPSDFPIDAKELEYKERMISCYPIHPEVFDRLYEDWATLERFQRTRGVLRLMAAVIHELWMSQDASPMIMPGSFTLNVPVVRDELTRYLDDNWNGVVDSEIDGKNSLPFKQDAANVRYGSLLASRRVARAIMLGSAPDVSGQTARGIEKTHIRLGVVQPGENISIFNDALSTLQSASSFMYSDGSNNRFWYDTRPTLRKVVEDRGQQLKDDVALFEIETRLKKQRKTSPFAGVHVCPNSSLDIPDEDTLRLVILPPAACHRGGSGESDAQKYVKEALSSRGTSPRMYKNMIVFAAADASLANQLLADAKKYLAWTSIKEDREALNLDVAQTRETEQSISRADSTLDIRIEEAYNWLLAPRIDLHSDSMDIEWEIDRIAGTGEGIVVKAGTKLLSNEAAIDSWAPALLKMELDRVLWKDKDYIQIKQLWGYLCTYCYLPRLSDYAVLENAINQGLSSKEYFGISAGYSDGRFMELTLGEDKAVINTSDVLVKPSVAKIQIAADEEELHKEEERRAQAAAAAVSDGSWPGDGVTYTTVSTAQGPNFDNTGTMTTETVAIEPEKKDPTRFFLATRLDNTRINRDIQNIVGEIVNQLTALEDAEIELTFEVKARVANGITVPVMRAISENCSTLRIDDYGFEQ